MKKNSPHLYLIITILLWSATPAVAKLALKELNNLQILFYINIVGSITLFSVVFFQGKIKSLKTLKGLDYLKMFGMGVLGVFLYYILLYGSFDRAPAGQANIINYLWPIFVVIFSIIILRERFNNKTFLAILISFIGALLVITRGDLSNFHQQYISGYLLAFAGAVCYGLFSVFGKKLYYEKFTSMLIYYLASLVLIIPTMLIFSDFVLPRSVSTILAVLFLGSLPNSIGFVLWFKALKIGQTSKMANIVYLTPFLALVLVYFINKEIIPLISILGLLLIVSGILIQVKNKPIEDHLKIGEDK